MVSTIYNGKKIIWVPLLESDIDAVDRIAREIHPTLPERKDVFAEKRRLFPQGCYKLMCDGVMEGYGLSHPWKLHSIPPLDALMHSLPPDPDCIYIHDVAVLREARGHNAAGLFVAQISDAARQMQIKHLSCVSVYGTDVLWARFGFRVVTSPEIASKLASYGGSATYMIADLAA